MRDRKGLSDKLAEARKRIAELEADLARLEQRDPLTRSLLSLTAFRAQLDLDVGRANRYVARIVRHEHERWDGDGYPDRLAGAQIPIGSRIILACDACHAMTSDRPYRRAMTHAEAMTELSGNAGAQFDPDVAQALVGYLFGRRQAGLAAV